MDSLSKVKPSITVELLGKKMSFRFNLRSCAVFKRLRGRSLIAGKLDLFDAEDIAAVLWAGLIPDNKELDGEVDANGLPDEKVKKVLDDLLDSLDLSDFPYLINDIIQPAIALTQPKESSSAKKKEKKTEVAKEEE